MPDRSSRSQRGGGFISISGLTPPELPDYQSDLNKQLSFLKSMDAYMNPGGSGGGTIRNANGLTPYQQAQLDYKLAKDAAKAAEAEAKKNVIVGTNPKTGQPMVYRNETGYKLSDKRMQEIYAGMLEDELRKDIANDEELNRIKGIAFGPKPISIDYRKQLERQYRDRTKALASIYKIDDRAAFDAAFGEQSKSIRNEQQRALNEDSFLSVLGSGVAQGWSDFLNAMRMPFQNETERLETARQSLKERQERIAASPTLREREMEEQEAAEQGKDISYWQATDKNRASNLAASVAGTLTSFAVPVGLSMAAAPFTGGASLTGLSSLATAVPIAATGVLGAGMNQLGQAQRAAQDPNLTEEQKTDVLSMSDPGFAGTTLLGGVAGALMPGGVGSGALKLANKAVGDAAATGIRGTIGRAAVRSAAWADKPRTMGTLARDIAVNSGENAAIMGANTIGANIAYNASTDQPLTQGATQGALGAIGEGAIIGVPFGGARTLRRPRVARAEAPAAGESAAETSSNTGETPAPQTPAPQTPAAQPQNTTWTQRLRTDSGFNAWSNDLVQATRTNNAAKVDELVAEYLAGGGRLEDLELIRDSYAKDSNKRLVSDAEFAKAHDGLGHVRVNDELGWGPKNDEGINAAIARWKEAENNDALDSKITGAFTGEPESSRVAGIMAELKPARAGSTVGQGNNANSSVETPPSTDAENVAGRTPVQNSADNSGVESERLGRKPTQNLGQTKGYTEDAGQEAAKQQEGVVPANAGSPRPRSGKTGDGTGGELNPTVGRDGSQSNAAANSGGEQSSSQPVATRGTPKSGKNKGTPDTLVVDGATFVRQPGVKSWKLRTTKGNKTSDLVINTKSVTPGMPDSVKAIKPSKRNEELTRLFDENVDNAKSTNPKGGVRESRALREPRQTKKVYKLMRIKRDEQGNVQRDENGNPILYPLFVGNDEPIKIGTTYSADSPDFSFLRSLPDGDWRVNMTTGEAQSWADYAAANNIKRRSPNKDDINAATATGSRWMRIRPAKNVQKNSGDKRTYHNIGLNGSGEVATFALRPGWHTTDVPTARQIKIRNDDHVWVEGSIAAERDYTNVDANGNYRDMISMPRDNNTEGFYRYYTSANAKQGNGDWYISSTFRPERIISDAEARSVVDAANARWNGSRRAEYDNPRASGREFTGFDTVREARGWHGSSADFDAFDLSHAHSGEGSAVHGWGAYIALDEKSPFDKTKRKSRYSGRSTAESYRDLVTRHKFPQRTEAFVSAGQRWTKGFDSINNVETWFDQDGKPVTNVLHRAFVNVLYSGSVENAKKELHEAIADIDSGIKNIEDRVAQLKKAKKAWESSPEKRALTEGKEHFLKQKAEYKESLAFLEQHGDLKSEKRSAKGKLYNVEVPDADKLLHLDNTFVEQPPFVQDALRRLLYNENNKGSDFSLAMRTVLGRYINGDDRTNGRRVYETLRRELGSENAASHMLNRYGIEGNYVFGHRDGPVAVVFNDKAIDILSKERRENLPSYLFSYEQAVGELSPLFKTQKEKDILATIAQLGGRSPDYIATLPDGSFATKSQLMEQAMQIVMSRMPGFKKGRMRADSGDGRALGRYNADTGDIFIDTTNATDAVRFLDTLQHEIGHKSLEELANPSLRTYTSEVMYNNFDPETAARVAETYETSRTDFVGEELYAQYESGATPFADTDSMRGALVSMFTNSNDEAVTRTVSRALSFFARNADSGTFNEFLKASIMSDKNVQDALIKNNLDSIDNALARQFAEDYRNVAHEADVPLNTETLGYYLDAVLDHDTSLNVWKRQSMPC